MRVRDKVVIGWLDPGQCDGMFAMTLARTYAMRAARIEGLTRIESGGLLSRGRNELVQAFMATDAEWLLMLDSDEQIDVDTFDKLVDTVHDQDRPIVAGLYFGWIRQQPVPLIFRRNEGTTTFNPIYDYPPDQVLEVDAAGTGCLMIHRSVFEAFQAEAGPHDGKHWCWFRDMPVNQDWFSEDHFFCARAKELGFKIHAHTGATLPHRKRFWLTEADYRASRG